MFASGRRPCSFITSNAAVIASRRFSINSLIVRLVSNNRVGRELQPKSPPPGLRE
jgi:hypothetical protein